VLAEPERTPYDLNFRLFGFRVRIHPLFWLGTVILGLNALRQENGPIVLLIWVVVVFVSILVHELGHALAYRMYRSDAHIVLWIFGGLAVGTPDVAGRKRRIFVSLAGPLASLTLFGIVYGSHLLTNWGISHGELVADLYLSLFFVNLVWTILNLFPVYPLDGGQVSRELCEGKWPGRGTRLSLQISFWFAVAVAVYCLACELDSRVLGRQFISSIPLWARGTAYTGILFGLLAFNSYQLLQYYRGRGYYYEGADDRLPWEK
jgi:Zn-dependent protease